MFTAPQFSLDQVLYTCFGVFLLWAAWGREGLRLAHLRSVLALLGCPRNCRVAVDFAVTMCVGVVVAVAFVQPQTAQQAIAAGLGWTGLVTRPVASGSGGQQ